ncbi:MAG: short-chain dehydrogenase, partial [Gammaproteobacteria bacterium]|nr:short-chain dehydrogenase [Gammaproteobacteria bacterium]
PMTAHLEKGPLWSTPEIVAKKIVTSIERKRHTVYTPGYWRIIMATACSIPEFVFKRLKF